MTFIIERLPGWYTKYWIYDENRRLVAIVWYRKISKSISYVLCADHAKCRDAVDYLLYRLHSKS